MSPQNKQLLRAQELDRKRASAILSRILKSQIPLEPYVASTSKHVTI